APGGAPLLPCLLEPVEAANRPGSWQSVVGGGKLELALTARARTKLRDLLLRAFADPLLEPLVDRICGQQRERLFGRRERAFVVAVGQVAVAETVLGVGRGRMRLGVQREQRDRVLRALVLERLVASKIQCGLGKE